MRYILVASEEVQARIPHTGLPCVTLSHVRNRQTDIDELETPTTPYVLKTRNL